MQLIVDSFENVTADEFKVGKKCLYWSSTLESNRINIGAVDAMMKKDLKSIVNAYKALVKKRGNTTFDCGPCEIHIRAGLGETSYIVIKGKITN